MNTTIQQGSFIANGNDVFIPLRASADWIDVWNYTQAAAQTNGFGFHFYYQNGAGINAFGLPNGNAMLGGRGIVEQYGAGAAVLANVTAANAFTYLDTSLLNPSARAAVTGTTNAAAPVVTTALANVAVGSIVRLEAVTDAGLAGVPGVCGFDFQVGAITPGVDFTMAYNLANAPGQAGTAGFARVIAPNPVVYPMFYPRRRYVCNVTQAAQAVVTTTVTNQYTVGQKVRFIVPPAFGMIELNGLQGTVVATAAGNFTVDIDTTAFTAFTWPLLAAFPTTFAQVVPVGEDTASALAAIPAADILADATRNVAMLGFVLANGALLPGGSNNDVIFWRAGKNYDY